MIVLNLVRSVVAVLNLVGTHRFRQTARSGRCPIRKNRTITLQKNYPQELKTLSLNKMY